MRPVQSQSRRATAPVIVTATSTSTRKVSTLQSLGMRRKRDVDIVLDGKDEFIHSYSTFDEVKGLVHIRLEKDTQIDGLSISLQGQTDTWVEKMTTASPRTGRATAKHVFLRMQQPIDDNPFSEDNIAQAGVTYTIPFTFVVPEKVLPFICNHTVVSDSVKAQHLLLPPSIGDEMLSGEGSILMDDLCPAMAKIVYSIRVGLVKASINGRAREVVQESVGIRITPARSELPPEIIPSCTDTRCLMYELRKEKNVRKGFLKLGKKSGRLIAETTQPRSLRLPHAQQTHKGVPMTTATISMRYDPASAEEEPPQLSSVDSKLKVYTFFGAQPYRKLPDPSNYDVWSVLHSQYGMSVDLSTMNLSSVQWTKHEPDSQLGERVRQDSVATSTSSNVAARQLSSSTGMTSTRPQPQSQPLRASASQESFDSNDSYSATSSVTTLSSAASPTMTTSAALFPGPAVISPSMKYNSALPYYTASIMVPVTLPTAPGSNSSLSDDAVDSEQQPRRGSTDASTIMQSTSGSIASSFGRRRGKPTFIPSFHSCLVSRIYALDLTIHSSNPAPQIMLRTPIQISSDAPPSTTQAVRSSHRQTSRAAPPSSWYDPFTTTDGEYSDKQDTANDEAIARALQSSTGGSAAASTNHHYNHQIYHQDNDDAIPSYAEIQTNTFPSSIGTLPRHNSTPAAADFVHHHLPRHDEHQDDEADDQPPEYHATAGFRRRPSAPVPAPAPAATSASASASAAHSTTAGSRATAAPQEDSQIPARRRPSLGWSKKLGLRS